MINEIVGGGAGFALGDFQYDVPQQSAVELEVVRVRVRGMLCKYRDRHILTTLHGPSVDFPTAVCFHPLMRRGQGGGEEKRRGGRKRTGRWKVN